jgi:hypothetical protein
MSYRSSQRSCEGEGSAAASSMVSMNERERIYDVIVVKVRTDRMTRTTALSACSAVSTSRRLDSRLSDCCALPFGLGITTTSYSQHSWHSQHS